MTDYSSRNDRELLAVRIEYMGTLFRSILEARWAVFFDAIGAKWKYEPKTFIIGKHYHYTPDFYLPNVSLRSENTDGVYIEIKPRSADIEERNLFYMAFPGDLIAFAGNPPCDDGGEQFGVGGWDNCMLFVKCLMCQHIKIEFHEGNYMVCPRCGGEVVNSDFWHGKYQDPFHFAVRASKSARVRQTGAHPQLTITDDDRLMMALQL